MARSTARSVLTTAAGAVGAAPLACALLALLLALLAPAARAAEYGAGAPIAFRLFPADNAWNTPVDTLPLDPNSADYIAHMSPGTGLHPDFGTVWEGAAIGIPYTVVPGTQPKVPIHFTEFGSESDPGPYPIPPDALVEGAGGPYQDGDRHVLVLDADNQKLYELYHAVKQPDGSWNAGSGAVFDLTGNALRPDGWTSCDAAGLPILPGLARYDEAVTEGVIDHALRFTVSESQAAYVYPATHYASDDTNPDLPPMGLRVRLKASFDISGFPAQLRPVLQALKTYGMMVADNGADWYVGGAPDARWDDEALSAISQVKGSDFEVVDSRALLPGAFYVSLPATATVREGTAWSRAGSFFDGAGASWNGTVDWDGAGGDAPASLPLGTSGAAGASGTFALAHTWPDETTADVTVTVGNHLGDNTSATTAVTVVNVSPRVSAGAGLSIHAGATLRRQGSFRDPGADRWSGWVRWGDGTARRALRLRADKTFPLVHRFPARRGRVYTVTVRVNDGDGGRGTDRFRVTVR